MAATTSPAKAIVQAFIASHVVWLSSCAKCAQPVQDADLGTVVKLPYCHHIVHCACLDTIEKHQCPSCLLPTNHHAHGDLPEETAIVQTNNPVCTICLDPIDHNPYRSAVKLPTCAHVFHDYCIARWLMMDNTCPTCKSAVPMLPNAAQYAENQLQMLRDAAPCFVPPPPGPNQRDVNKDKCLVCRTPLNQVCVDCVCAPKPCEIIYGECGHLYHLHCHQRLGGKLAYLCPCDGQYWTPVGLTPNPSQNNVK